MYIVSGHLEFLPGQKERALEIMLRIVTLGRTEPGIHHYTFYEDPGDPNRFFLYDEWDSKPEHNAHFNGAAMQDMLPAFMELLAAPPIVTYYHAIVESTL